MFLSKAFAANRSTGLRRSMLRPISSAQEVTEVRMETDSFGEIAVPVNKLYGAQTARSMTNFKVSDNEDCSTSPLNYAYARASPPV